MFDARKAFEPLQGITFLSLATLRSSLRQVLQKHALELPSDAGVEDLIAIIRENGWLQETRERLQIRIKEPSKNLWEHLKE